MKRIRQRPPAAEIPTSSMADIAFLLIIFFMVTAVFAATKGLELKIPAEQQGDPDPEPAVLIHVRRGTVAVDCRPMDGEAMLAYLETRLGRNPDKFVVVYADPDAAYREFVAVYDLLRQAGVRNLSVPTGTEIAGYVATFGENPFAAHCPPSAG